MHWVPFERFWDILRVSSVSMLSPWLLGKLQHSCAMCLHVLGFVQSCSAPWPTEKRYVTKTGVTVMRGGGEYAFAARGCTSESVYGGYWGGSEGSFGPGWVQQLFKMIYSLWYVQDTSRNVSQTCCTLTMCTLLILIHLRFLSPSSHSSLELWPVAEGWALRCPRRGSWKNGGALRSAMDGCCTSQPKRGN